MAIKRVTKSVSFTEEEEHILNFAENQGAFSNYVKSLIKKDKEEKEKGYKFSKEQEKAIIELIKKFAPAVKEEEIQKDFDSEQNDFLSQF